MACGCSTIETPPCGLSVEVCKGWYVALDFVAVSITQQPTHGELISLGANHYIYQHDGVDLTADVIEYSNGLQDCTISITILDTVPEDTQLVSFTASGECLVGEPTYHWTLPEGVTLHPNDTLYQQTIHVYVPLYDPENPDLTYELRVDVCCGNCNDCCKCDTIIWNPPICTEECGEDPDCYCDDPCHEYNPLTGNCEYICEEDQHCCLIEGVVTPADVASIDGLSIECTTVSLDPLNGNLIDITLTLTAETTGLTTDELIWTIANPDECGNPLTDCGVDWRLCGEDAIIAVHSDELISSMPNWLSIRWDDGSLQVNMDGAWVNAYQTNIDLGAPDLPFNIFVNVSADGHCTSIQANYVIQVSVVDFKVCNTHIELLDTQYMAVDLCNEDANCPEVLGDTYICQDCCDDTHCPEGQLCIDGICRCPYDNSIPDPITGLCPCPDPLPVCTNCIPTTGYPILVTIGENPNSCTAQETFNPVTCQCECKELSCYQMIINPETGNPEPSECQVCPICTSITEAWWQIVNGVPTPYGVSCLTCETCIANTCVPVVCGPGTIPNPRPNIQPCCVADPCDVLSCDECPTSDLPCGCDPDITNSYCVTCSTIDCIENDDCPFGCICDTDVSKCKDNPCAPFDCEGTECVLEPECGCLDNNCIPCNEVPCPNGNECPLGCACDEDTQICVDNPCYTAQCSDEDDLQTYCPVIDGCGCADLECVPCSTVSCPGGDIDCPFGCHCVDGTCQTDPCTTLEIECGLNVIPFTYQFNLLHSLVGDTLNITVDLSTTEWLTDSILSAPLSDILEWELNLSPYEDGYVSITDINTFLGISAITETANGIAIDLNYFDYEFLMIRCTVLNTDIGGTPISITYRYQTISDEVPEWSEALGSICYTMYTIEPNVGIPFNGVTQWFIDYDADEIPDLVITPTDPEDSTPVYTGGGSGYEVAFAGNEYLIITCPQAGDYVVTANVNSGECLDVTACGTGESCPCEGSSGCEVDVVELNSLSGNIWTVGVDFFDQAGFQQPWQCEPISEIQGCEGISQYNTLCGGLVPIEYDLAVLIPENLCCNSDIPLLGSGVPWEEASEILNNNWEGNSNQCAKCCCGWAHSGVNILSVDGASITAEITNFAEAKLCFQISLSGGGTNIDDPCCKHICFTPPPPTCEDMTVTGFDISCTPKNHDGFEFSLDITNPNSSGPYSIELVNNNVCYGGSCNPYAAPCDPQFECYCTPDGPDSYSCQPYPYMIPMPEWACDGISIPAGLCQPYNSGDTITVQYPYPLFPLTPDTTETFIITDLTTGCQVQYQADIPCCTNFNVTTSPIYCIKASGSSTLVSIVGYDIFVFGPYDETYTVVVEIDYDLGSDPTPTESMEWFEDVCIANPSMGCILQNGSNPNGTYTNIPTGGSVRFGGVGGVSAGGSDTCPANVWNLQYANLANYDIQITVSPTQSPNCQQVVTFGQALIVDYSIACGIEAVDITVQVLNHVLGTVYNVTVSNECGTPVISQNEEIITISGCVANNDNVFITVTNAIDPNNTANIIIPSNEISDLRAECPCMDVLGYYDCATDQLNVLINSSSYGNDIDFVISPVGFICGNMVDTTFTGPIASFDFSDLVCSVLSGTEYTFQVSSVDHPSCIGTFTIDTSICNTPCMTDPAPSFTYDCTAGFSFSNITDVTHIYYVNGSYDTCPDANCIEIFEADPCPGGCFEGSGILWFVYSNGCFALLGINNMPHTIEHSVTSFPDPPAALPYLVCEPAAYVTFQVIGGTPPFTITSSAGLFAPYTLNTTDIQIAIPIDDPTPTPGLSTVEIASDVINCPVEIEVDYNCVQDCLNDPSLMIQCGGCEAQQVWHFGSYNAGTGNVFKFRTTTDGNPPVDLGVYPGITGSNFLSWMVGAYVNTVLPALGVSVIFTQEDINILDYDVYVVAPCCTEWELLELSVGNVWIEGTPNGLMSCQQIKNLDAAHKCCFCFTAAKTGVVTSPTITDEIQYGCKNSNTGVVVWATAPMQPDGITTECINCYDIDPTYSASTLYFQREIEYADGCLERSLAYLLHDSGASVLYCRLSTQGYFVIELENVGVLPIPTGTTFNLNWIGLGTSPIYTAITNCTMGVGGTSITTTGLVPIGGKIKFQARYNNVGCAINSNTIEITTSDITLNWTPIVITKTL